MDYKEPKKRVTKNDKKNKKQVYSQKHVRNMLKQKEATLANKNHGAVPAPECALFPNGRVLLHRRPYFFVHRKDWEEVLLADTKAWSRLPLV